MFDLVISAAALALIGIGLVILVVLLVAAVYDALHDNEYNKKA